MELGAMPQRSQRGQANLGRKMDQKRNSKIVWKKDIYIFILNILYLYIYHLGNFFMKIVTQGQP